MSHHRTNFLHGLLLAVLLIAVPVAFGQGNTVSLGGVTAVVPSGWVSTTHEPSGSIYIASTADALTILESGGSSEFAAGEIGISIATPAILGQLGMSETAEAVTVLNTFLEALSASGEVTPDTTFSVPAARVSVEGEAIPGGAAILYALQFETGTVMVAIQSSDGTDESDPTVAAVLASIRFGASAATGAPLSQWASGASGSSQYGSTSWSFAQATGEPDTTECGDRTTAWASASSTGVDTLTLTYAHAVIPQVISVHQTYNPGAITRVEVGSSATGETFILPDSADPKGNTPCPGIFTLEVSGITTPVDTITLYLDQTLTGSWNEIDAVQLTGITSAGLRQWASGASGSSQYGSTSWSFAQATGEPNTTECGDRTTAWASASSTGVDTLTLTFDDPVVPAQIHIHQTYNPGAITRVEVGSSATGETFLLPNSADPEGNTPCPGVFTLEVSGITTPVDTVTLYLDQTLTGSWNEIDAVELVGSAG